MRKESLKVIVFTFVIVTLSFGIVLVTSSVYQKKLIAENTGTLPSLTLSDTRGHIHYTQDLRGDVVLVLFNSTCEHCQAELNDFRQNHDRLEQCKTLFVSTEPLNDIRSFSQLIVMDHFPAFTFCHLSLEESIKNFGTTHYPEIFIYRNHALLKHFTGETNVETIINVLAHSE
jgi:cytochrome oxidase Cu insertion factor (SCO1/SenC/PrrC family)